MLSDTYLSMLAGLLEATQALPAAQLIFQGHALCALPLFLAYA